MKAISITDQQESIELIEAPNPEPQATECLVKISYASLNRRDQWIREGLYPGIKPGVILGSDGCGEVVKGPEKWVGKKVIINPNIGWGDDPAVQSPAYTILGLPTDGTLAEFVKVAEDRLVEKPDYLEDSLAAAIPLAALTAYRAVVTKGQVTKGQKVLVSGAGGGVAQFAVAIAANSGCDVFVTSGNPEKIKKSIAIGAVGGFNYREEDWTKQASKSIGGFDVIIDGAGGNALNDYLKVTKPGGKIVIYGGTSGKTPKFDIPRLFWSQVSVLGSTMGNDQEFVDMIKFFETHEITPVIDATFNCSDYLQAFDRFKAPDHFGKIVVAFQESFN